MPWRHPAGDPLQALAAGNVDPAAGPISLVTNACARKVSLSPGWTGRLNRFPKTCC
jgi:hypothetical protein